MSDYKKKSEVENVYQKLNAYKPENKKDKKHQCEDCYNCLFCSDVRCNICRKNDSS